MSFSEDVKNISEKFKGIDRILQQNIKTVKPLNWRRKYRNYEHGLLTLCVKPPRNLKCQVIIDGKVFCMAETPCWRQEKWRGITSHIIGVVKGNIGFYMKMQWKLLMGV